VYAVIVYQAFNDYVCKDVIMSAFVFLVGMEWSGVAIVQVYGVGEMKKKQIW